MAVYSLNSILRFTNGRDESVIDTLRFEADTRDDAILRAKDYQPSMSDVELQKAILTDESGAIVWTLTGPLAVI